ncbi:porin [Vibrio agarivorans]|uniref:Porin n=1 Tax=Vibrio agarivorans TaxID=153622 RepID=A0ABT7Y3G2_9VIBR|nr:porin [Vibrio agarivorans]MDN2482573.1 porin [Vibrio agarivorans]
MKTSAVASALLLALASTSTVAATVYSNDGTELSIGGRVEFRGDFIGDADGAEVDGTMSDASRMRFNFKGKTEITNGLSAFGVYEGEQRFSENNIRQRYMYAGLDTEVGAFSFGKQDHASVIISDLTDITEFSGVQQAIDASSDKEDSVIAYRGGFDAVEIQATYQANSEKDSDKYSLAALYSAPFGLDAGIAYSGGDIDNDADQDQVLLGLGYSFENFYIGGTFSTGSDNTDKDGELDFDAYELAATYKFTKEFTLAAMYTYRENDPKALAKYDNVEGFELAGYYRFNSNFRTYVSYYMNQLDEVKNADGLVTAGEDTLRLGVRYDF